MTNTRVTALEAVNAAIAAGFQPRGEHLAAHLFHDLKSGIISADASLQILKRCISAADEGKLRAAMRDAFRWVEAYDGGAVRLLNRSQCPFHPAVMVEEAPSGRVCRP